MTDIQMPEMDGYEVARRAIQVGRVLTQALKRDNCYTYHKVKKECPIVAITAFYSEDVVGVATKAGIKEVCLKPVECNEL